MTWSQSSHLTLGKKANKHISQNVLLNWQNKNNLTTKNNIVLKEAFTSRTWALIRVHLIPFDYCVPYMGTVHCNLQPALESTWKGGLEYDSCVLRKAFLNVACLVQNLCMRRWSNNMNTCGVVDDASVLGYRTTLMMWMRTGRGVERGCNRTQAWHEAIIPNMKMPRDKRVNNKNAKIVGPPEDFKSRTQTV